MHVGDFTDNAVLIKEVDTCEETLSTREEHRAEGALDNEVKISQGTRSPSSFELQPRELKGADRWPRESEQEDHGWR